ncbi:MAG: MmgE/PrpD family protein [Steroidobacteraceae bacterium]
MPPDPVPLHPARSAAGVVLQDIAQYVREFTPTGEAAYQGARLVLRDALGRAFRALHSPACRPFIGPIVRGATMPGGARVPGTSFELDPVQAAFSLGILFGAAEREAGSAADRHHPADALAAILALSDHLARRARMEGRRPATVRELLTALVKACEIRGTLAFGSPALQASEQCATAARAAAAAVATGLLGGSAAQIVGALDSAIDDDGPTPRGGPAASRAVYTTADVASRGLQFALLAMQPGASDSAAPGPRRRPLAGLPSGQRAARLVRPLGSHVIESLAREVYGAPQPLIGQRFAGSVAAHFPANRVPAILGLFARLDELDTLAVNEFVAQLVTN